MNDVVVPLSRATDSKSLPLARRQKWVLAAFFGFWVIFGGLVEFRCAFLNRRMGDVDCFFRGAWAIRTGADLYSVTDNNGYHYNYPPLLAILLSPLADPPAGADRTGMLPFGVSVLIFYALNLVLWAAAVHMLASAFEERIPGWNGTRRWSQRWWALRLVPSLICLVPIGHTMMRGQSNLLVLALVAFSLAALLRGRRFQSGFALAIPAAIKIFPAFLVLFPLWRRDLRGLLGYAAGLFVALGLIPLAALGPERTVQCYTRLAEVLILPGLGAGSDTSRADELTNITATDSQSLLAIWHKTRYLHLKDADRPTQPASGLRLLTTCICGVLTLATLLAAGRRPSQDPAAAVCFFGCLVMNMLLLCPVCHLHYFTLAVPLLTALLVWTWQDRPRLGLPWVTLTLAATACFALPNLPGMGIVKNAGLAMYFGIVLWSLGVVGLWRKRNPTAASSTTIRNRAA